MELAIARLEGDRRQLAARLAGLQLRAHSDETALLEMAEVAESLAALERRIQQRRQDLERLTIEAPRSGIVFPAAPKPPAEDIERLPTWSGHPLQQKNLAAHLEEGVSVCQIGDPVQLEALLAINEETVKSVRSGQHVDLFFRQRRGERFSGTIAQVSHTDIHVTPVDYSRPLDDTGRQRPRSDPHRLYASNTYQASLPLDLEGTTIVAGGRGKAKIHVGYRSLGQRCWESLCRTFHFEM
jgi:putative peptide zinc metalloprotease protein